MLHTIKEVKVWVVPLICHTSHNEADIYSEQSSEGACNYHLNLGAIQIQIISQLTSKYGNHSFNQVSE